MTRHDIKDFYGRIIGYIETDERTGNKTGRDFYGRILGYYDKRLNVTRDFYQRIVAQGDALSGLIWEEENKNHNVDISKKNK